MINTNKIKMAVTIAIIFSLIYSIGFITPMNSDDYTYALRDLSASGIKLHYLGWSGRVVSDTISTFLLKFFPPSYLQCNKFISTNYNGFMLDINTCKINKDITISIFDGVFYFSCTSYQTPP